MDSQIRRIPRLMMSPQEIATLNQQQSTVEAKAAAVITAGAKQELGFSNDQEGVCPICHEQMKLSVANGVDVYTCILHRVAMPIRNEGQ